MANFEKTLDLMEKCDEKPEFEQLDLETYHLPENYQGSKCTFNLVKRLSTIRSRKDITEPEEPKYKDSKLNYLYHSYKHILPQDLKGETADSEKPNVEVSDEATTSRQEQKKKEAKEDTVTLDKPIINIEAPKSSADVKKEPSEVKEKSGDVKPKVASDVPKVVSEIPKTGTSKVVTDVPEVRIEGNKQGGVKEQRKRKETVKTSRRGSMGSMGSVNSVKSFQENRFLSVISKVDSKRFEDFLRRMNLESANTGKTKLQKLALSTADKRRSSVRPDFLQTDVGERETLRFRRRTIALTSTISERRSSHSMGSKASLCSKDSSSTGVVSPSTSAGKRKSLIMKWAKVSSFEDQVRRMMVR